MTIDPRLYRQLMGCFTTGIAVVTTRGETGENIGLTVNSVTSVSLDPPLVLFCLDRQAHLYATFRSTETFALNFLAEGQEPVSRHFADRHHNPQPNDMWDDTQNGYPILRQTLGWLACKKSTIHPAGDHDIFVGEVTDLHKRATQRDPLLYFHGRYRRIAPI